MCFCGDKNDTCVILTMTAFCAPFCLTGYLSGYLLASGTSSAGPILPKDLFTKGESTVRGFVKIVLAIQNWLLKILTRANFTYMKWLGVNVANHGFQ